MGWGDKIAVAALLILLSVTGYAAPSADFDALKTEASNILEEVVALRVQVTALQSEIDQMSSDLEKAKNRLKKISIASREARRHLKRIRDVEPVREMEFATLQNLQRLLQEKQTSFQIVADEMDRLQDEVGGTLMQTAEEDSKLSLR